MSHYELKVYFLLGTLAVNIRNLFSFFFNLWPFARVTFKLVACAREFKIPLLEPRNKLSRTSLRYFNYCVCFFVESWRPADNSAFQPCTKHLVTKIVQWTSDNYLYSAFLVLTTQSTLQDSFTFTQSHTHIHTVHLLAALCCSIIRGSCSRTLRHADFLGRLGIELPTLRLEDDHSATAAPRCRDIVNKMFLHCVTQAHVEFIDSNYMKCSQFLLREYWFYVSPWKQSAFDGL